METGALARVFDYYFGKDVFADEVGRAAREFFDDISPNEATEREQAFFNEWFMFDFTLKNGKTPLEDFAERNPRNYNPARLQLYKDLQEQEYGMYEVLDVELGEGLRLKVLHSGNVYTVREYSGTFQVDAGELAFGRIGKVGGHWEIVGADSIKFPADAKEIKELRATCEYVANPKILKDLLVELNLRHVV